jgi:peptidylprolyl isomerase
LAKEGDRVKVHYTGSLKDGTVFDSSLQREPLEFTLGSGAMIAGFEKAVYGMQVGQSKKVTIPVAEAYGPYNEERVMTFNRNKLPAGLSPKVGDHLRMRGGDGNSTLVKVIKVTDAVITLDANHELAGKDLTFEIKLVEIK